MSSPPDAALWRANVAKSPSCEAPAEAPTAGGGLSTHTPLSTVLKFDTHSVQWVEFVHALQFEGHGAQLPAAVSPNWPSGQKVLQLPTATWYALNGLAETATQPRHLLASAAAVHVLQVWWQG